MSRDLKSPLALTLIPIERAEEFSELVELTKSLFNVSSAGIAPFTQPAEDAHVLAREPMYQDEGRIMGELWIADQQPRQLTADDLNNLKFLARISSRLARTNTLLVDQNVHIQKVQSSERLLNAFFASSPLMMGIVEVRNNEIMHLSDNEATIKFFSSKPSQDPTNARDLGASERNIAIWLEKYLQAKSSGQPVRFSYEHQFPNSIHQLEATVCHLGLDGEGRDLFSYVAEDATERYRLLEELRNGQLKLETITNHIGDVIWMSDPKKQQIIFISPAYEDVWEETCGSLYRNIQSFIDVIHPEDRERVIAAFPKQLDGTYDEIYRLSTRSGQTKWIHDRAFPVLQGADGSVSLVVGIATEITDKVEKDEIIAQQQQRMIISERLSSLGEMAGGIAHEINNPLSIILMRSHLLVEMVDSGKTSAEKLKEGLTKIGETALRISKIVKSLRAFARVQDNDPFVPKNVSEIVDETLEFIQARAKNQEIDLRSRINFKGEIDCRPVEISQVILNLLTNAYDAVEGTSKPWIEIAVEEDETSIQISVTDSGAGIPSEIQSKIWNPFYTTKAVGKGTGLGLSVSRTLIERHGGTLAIDPHSKHTRFVICVPKTQVAHKVA